MATGGKSPDPNAVRINPIIFGMVPDVAHGALPIPHFNRVTVARPQSVLQNEGCDADRIKPFRDVSPLLLHGKVNVAAAWAYNNAGSHGFRGVREINRERRNIFR